MSRSHHYLLNIGLEFLCHQKLPWFLNFHRSEDVQSHTILYRKANLISIFSPHGSFGLCRGTYSHHKCKHTGTDAGLPLTPHFYRPTQLLGWRTRQNFPKKHNQTEYIHVPGHSCLIDGVSQTTPRNLEQGAASLRHPGVSHGRNPGQVP